MAQEYDYVRTFGATSPALDPVGEQGYAVVGNVRHNTDHTSPIIDWICTVEGRPGTWVPRFGGFGAYGLPRVADLAALAAIVTSGYTADQAHVAEVLTLRAFFNYTPTPIAAWSNATAYVVGDLVTFGGSTYVAVAAGTNHATTDTLFWNFSVVQVASADGLGRWIRMGFADPYWVKRFTDGTGLFINSQTGNDEADGASGAPIQSLNEVNRRLAGANLTGAAQARLTVLGTGTTFATRDRYFTGWRGSILLIGTPTVVASGIVLTAAGDVDALAHAGFITCTSTDFLTLGYRSTTARSLWVRRANTSGGGTTYAPIYLNRNSGGNFTAEIGPQVSLSSTLTVTAVTTQVFAPGDTVELVSFPVWTSIVADRGITVNGRLLDHAASSTLQGVFADSVCGTRGDLSLTGDGTAYTPTGWMMNGTLTCNRLNQLIATAFALGTQDTPNNYFNINGGRCVMGRFTMEHAQIALNNGGYVEMGSAGSSDSWVQHANQQWPFEVLHRSQMQIYNGITIGIGPGVPSGATSAVGGLLIGASRLSTAVNAFTSSLHWTVGGIYPGKSYSTAQLGGGIVDNETQSSIVWSGGI